MEITKIEFERFEGRIIVRTSVFPNLGFNFKIEDIIDRGDLILKIKQRLIKEAARVRSEQDNQNKFDQLKSLEGTEL